MNLLSRWVRTTVVLALLAALSSLGACSSSQPIINHWVHSHEEDSASTMVYRPSTFDFPLSRGRQGFDFRADGLAIIYTIAPADGSMADTGRWTLNDRMLTVSPMIGGRPMRFDVVYVDTALLKLSPMR